MSDIYDVDYEKNTRKRVNFGVPCRKSTLGEECPECEAEQRYRALARKATDAGVKASLDEKVSMLRAKPKIFINAINMRDEREEFAPKIFAVPPTAYDDLLEQARGIQKINPELNIFHPLKGGKVHIERRGQGVQTRYKVKIDPTPFPLPNMDALQKLHNLDDIVKILETTPHVFETLAPGPNVLRMLPAWDGKKLLFMEVKFHNFSANYVANGDQKRHPLLDQGEGGPSVSSSASSVEPGFGSSSHFGTAKEEEGMEAASFFFSKFSDEPASATPMTAAPPQASPVTTVHPPTSEDLKMNQVSSPAQEAKKQEIQDMMARLERMKAEAGI